MANVAIGTKNRPWQAVLTQKNGETSASIVAGQPVVLSMSGTDDGFSVVLPGTAGANKSNALFMGIACNPNTWVAGSYNDIICGGFVQNVRMVVGTRSATTAAWASYVAQGVGDACSVDTVNNAIAWSATAPAGQIADISLLDSIASATTIASSVSSVTWTNSYNTAFTILNLPSNATVATISARLFLHHLG